MANLKAVAQFQYFFGKVNRQTCMVEVSIDFRRLSKYSPVFEFQHFEVVVFIGYYNERARWMPATPSRQNTKRWYIHYCVLIVLTSTPEGRCFCHLERSKRYRPSALQPILHLSLKSRHHCISETETASVL